MKLKKARKRAKITQDEIAEALEISRRHYQNIEYGIVDPGVTTALRIAKFLGVSPYNIDEWYTRIPVSTETKATRKDDDSPPVRKKAPSTKRSEKTTHPE
ncbi:helix-turn-helix transcriptional regulator [Cohnella soli]|uniref:Helix-turn-helix transcriptional regulator n=1 Tax=Cohnella soli TaxID=425005 RepID=A0ABW0HRY8_9BACL